MIKKNGKDILKTFRITAWTNSNQTWYREFFHKRKLMLMHNFMRITYTFLVCLFILKVHIIALLKLC